MPGTAAGRQVTTTRRSGCCRLRPRWHPPPQPPLPPQTLPPPAPWPQRSAPRCSKACGGGPAVLPTLPWRGRAERWHTGLRSAELCDRCVGAPGGPSGSPLWPRYVILSALFCKSPGHTVVFHPLREASTARGRGSSRHARRAPSVERHHRATAPAANRTARSMSRRVTTSRHHDARQKVRPNPAGYATHARTAPVCRMTRAPGRGAQALDRGDARCHEAGGRGDGARLGQ